MMDGGMMFMEKSIMFLIDHIMDLHFYILVILFLTQVETKKCFSVPGHIFKSRVILPFELDTFPLYNWSISSLVTS